MGILEFLLSAIGIVIGIIAVIVICACACAPLMMGRNNKSIVDQDQDEPKCEFGGDCDCYDCWKRGEK